jgi:hypothetical protein
MHEKDLSGHVLFMDHTALLNFLGEVINLSNIISGRKVVTLF